MCNILLLNAKIIYERRDNMNQEKVGKFISKLRKEKKLTQEQLAEKMSVSTNAVSKWERGLSFPDVSLYKKICNELDISIEELINGEKDNSEKAKEKAIISVATSKERQRKNPFRFRKGLCNWNYFAMYSAALLAAMRP